MFEAALRSATYFPVQEGVPFWVHHQIVLRLIEIMDCETELIVVAHLKMDQIRKRNVTTDKQTFYFLQFKHYRDRKT